MKRRQCLIRRKPIACRRLVRVKQSRLERIRIALIWRKSGAPAVGRLTHASTSSVFNRWSPRYALHLHFALNESRHVHGRATSFVKPARLSWGRSYESVRSVLQSTRTEHESRRRTSIDRQILTQFTRSRTVRERVTHNGIIRSHDLLLRRHLSTESFALRQLPSRQNGRRNGHTTTVRFPEAQAVWRQSIRHLASPAQEGLPKARTEFRAASIPFRPPDLIWRTENEPRLIEAFERSVNAAASSAAASAFAPSSPDRSQAVMGAELHGRALLDPAQMDRLAEDVIGRVERRIRIERERRGV